MVIGSVLFAAGLGKRLQPLSGLIPKAGLPMLDVPLGGFALADLERTCPPVVMNIRAPRGGLLEALSACAGDRWEPFIEEPAPLGTAGTLRALRGRLGARLATRNADLLTDLPTERLVAAHERIGAEATIAVAPAARGADLTIARGRADRIIDRRAEPEAPGWVFLGMSVFERAALATLDEPGPLDFVRSLLGPVVRRGELAVHVHDGYAVDVGTPARFLAASQDLLHGRGPRAPIPWPGEIVEVAGGRAYVGPGANVTDDALKPGAIVLARATVERGATVGDAIVWPGEVVPARAKVRDGIYARGDVIPVR